MRKLDSGKTNGSNGTNGDSRAMTRKMSQVHLIWLSFDILVYVVGGLGETIAIEIDYVFDSTDSNLGIGERCRSCLSQRDSLSI